MTPEEELKEATAFYTLSFKFKVKTAAQAQELAKAMYALYNEKANLWCGTFGNTYAVLPEEFNQSPSNFFDENEKEILS